MHSSLRCAPDLFGHGVLPTQRAQTTFSEECRRLLDLSKAANAEERPTLLGYSLGARVALGMLATAPTVFSRAVLVAPNPGLRDETEREQRLSLENAWCEQILSQGLESFVDRWETMPIFESQSRLDIETLERQRSIRTSHFPEGIVASIRALGLGAMPDFWPLLATLELPITLVCGAFDQKFRKIAEEMLGLLPQARLEIIDDCGHNPVLEQPEKFWKRIALA